MNIALIAHDKKKDNLVQFATAYKTIFANIHYLQQVQPDLRISEATGLDIHRFQSGPLGGDQQIGAMIAKNEMDAVFFFRDPLTAQPHEPDVTALVTLM